MADRVPAAILGTVLIAFAAFIGLSIVAVGAAWAAATGHGVLVAIIVIAVGAMLALAAFNGGARWLIAPALAVAIPLGVVSAADVSLRRRDRRAHLPAALGRLGAGGV